MLRVTIALALALAVAADLHAQSEAGHVYSISEYRAHTGQGGAYNTALHESFRPVMDEVVRRGGAVRYVDLFQRSGDVGSTHLLMIEFADWESYGALPEALDEASQEIFGRPYTEVREEVFMPLREEVKRDVYVALPGGM